MKFLKKALSVLLCAGFITGLALSMIGCKQEIEPEEPKEYLPVSDLTVTAGYKQVTLNWTNPEDDELSSIEIKYGKSANNLSEKATCDASENKYSITGLENETKYYFTVYTIYSDSKSTKKASGTKNAETLKPEAVKGLKAEVTGTSTIKLSWTNQEGDFYKSKKITYGTDSSKLDKTIEIKDNTTTSAEVKDLSQDTKYYFQVTTVLSDDATVSSSKVNATTEKEKTEDTPPTEDNPPAENNPPANTKTYAAVSGLTSTAGYKQISLSWTNPTDTELSGLTVNYGTDSSNLSGTKTLAATVNSCSLTELANNTKYYFTVTAVYSDTNATKKTSSVLNATTVNPVGVSEVSCQNYTSNSITIRWTNQTGDFYTSRKVIYGTSESNLNNTFNITDNTATTATLTELSESTKYYIQVVTTLSDNATVASTTINKTTRSTSSSTVDLVNISSVDFAKQLTIGWNLGNTLDSSNTTGYVIGEAGLNMETYWRMPKTTETMIKAVHAEGFETIRIPVSWHNHINPSDTTNYTIDTTWMARVKEIVDWAIDDGMFVILNIHHDNLRTEYISSTPGFALSPDSTVQTKSKAYIQKVWEQIATEFASYDNHLIFEILNEPRDIGGLWKGNEWNCDDAEVLQCITDYETTGLTAIRSITGNANRFVMAGGYAASGTNPSMLDIYNLPADTSEDKLLLSTHAYSPYNFAMYSEEDSTHTSFTDEDKESLDSIFNYLKKNYTAKGIGVVMGEASSSDKNNTTERENWTTYYFTKAAEAGIPVILWDNMSTVSNGGEITSGECHGYFNRNSLTWYFPTLIAKMMEACTAETDLSDIVDCGLLDSPLNIIDWSNGNIQLSKFKFRNATSTSSLKFTVAAADGGSGNSHILKLQDKWSEDATILSNGSITGGTKSGNTFSVSVPATVTYTPTEAEWTKIKTNGLVIYGNNLKITYLEIQ